MHVDQIRVYQSGKRPEYNTFVWKMAVYHASESSSTTHWVCSDDPASIGKSGEYLCGDKQSDPNVPFIPDTPWFEDMPAVYAPINMLRVWVTIDGYAPEGTAICIDAFEITGTSCESPSMPPPSPPAPPTPPPMGCKAAGRTARIPAHRTSRRTAASEEECYSHHGPYPDAKYITWQELIHVPAARSDS